MGIIPEARSKYMRKRIAATAIKYKLKDFKLSVIGSQLRAKNQIQQSNGSNSNIIQSNIELNNLLKHELHVNPQVKDSDRQGNLKCI